MQSSLLVRRLVADASEADTLEIRFLEIEDIYIYIYDLVMFRWEDEDQNCTTFYNLWYFTGTFHSNVSEWNIYV